MEAMIEYMIPHKSHHQGSTYQALENATAWDLQGACGRVKNIFWKN
jgi:hypothetical protein